MKRKIFAVLLTAVMVLTLMPAMAFAADPVETDLSNYEVVTTDLQVDGWKIITDTMDNITFHAEVKHGDYVLPEDKYDLHIEMESWVDDKQVFTPVENGKIALDETGKAAFIAYAVAKDGSGLKGQTSRDCYFDLFYKYSIIGCNVGFPDENRITEIEFPMTESYSFLVGEEIKEPAVTIGNTILRPGVDYQISYVEGVITRVHVKDGKTEFDVYWVNKKEGGKTYDSIPTQKGMYQCIVKGLGDYVGEYDQTNLQICDENKMKVTASAKTVKYSKLKKKAQTAAPLKVSNAAGYVTYIGKGTDAKSKKALTINPKNGKVTVKKGTKKGTYKMKVTVSDSGDETTAVKIVTKTISIKVK